MLNFASSFLKVYLPTGITMNIVTFIQVIDFLLHKRNYGLMF